MCQILCLPSPCWHGKAKALRGVFEPFIGWTYVDYTSTILIKTFILKQLITHKKKAETKTKQTIGEQ